MRVIITNKEAVNELLMLKRTVKANSDADKALDKAIERLRLSNDKPSMVAMLKELEKELKEVKCNYLATIHVDIAEEYWVFKFECV